jgi:branched-chain amino acid transport system permease protein
MTPARYLVRNSLFWFSLVILLLPVAIGSGFYMNVMITVAIYAITAVGLCLLTGYTGQLSIAHAAFFGMGAYLSGILTSRFGLPPSLVFLISIVSVGIISYLVGLVVLRFRGHYLAIVTLSIVVIVEALIKELSFLTGGDQGLSGIPPFSIGSFVFDSELKIYYLTWFFLAAIVAFSLNLVNSSPGRALRAVKEGEDVARTLGVNASKYKTAVFVLSSIFAAISGSLFAHYIMFVTPQVASLGFAFEIILMVAFGGTGNVWGVIFGVGGILFLSEYLRVFEEYRLVIYGVLLVVIMLFFPQGVLHAINSGLRLLFRSMQRLARSLPFLNSLKGG